MSESQDAIVYCMKCKARREIGNPEAVLTPGGQPALRGTCPVCGTTLYKMGETESYQNVTSPKPPPAAAKPKPPKGVRTNGSDRQGKLVVVESPAKARTIENYLGKGYTVKASVGHVRDLLKSNLSVNVARDFEPTYRVPNDKRKVVKELHEAAERAEEIFLATDPDREGEAIAWHVMEAAEMDPNRTRRVVFYEITKDAVRQAFQDAHQIDMARVDAQQARRVLDRLVGYELSPLLWEKVRPRLSAGRVQSVAVRLVVEREREIETFVPQEYWSIHADLARTDEQSDPDRIHFLAKLLKIKGEDVNLPSQGVVEPLVAELEKSEYLVDDVKIGTRQRKAFPPFITSTLQQEASRRLGYTARRTMSVAQQLYEGLDLGGADGQVGLITYMRTDSTNISDAAREEAAAFIRETYGPEYLPKKPNIYTRKAKGAQEAHEAIRPTSALRTPESLRDQLNRDQFRLYQLIWQRFLASQMAPAVYDTIRVDVLAGLPGAAEKPYLFRATGSTLKFPGFLAVYSDVKDEDDTEEDDQNRAFPKLAAGVPLDLLDLLADQHFTQPPPRYTEASLVKALEEYGIGRPSTYAPIMNTIQQRGYVTRDGKRLAPSATGAVVNDLLVEHFPDIVDLNFTARMEEDLDEIAAGDKEWVPVVREFYEPFKRELEWAKSNVPGVELTEERIGRECPESGHDLVIRWGRFGKFIGCSNYPTCKYTEPLFELVGVTCPKCREGEIAERKTRKNRTFYGCTRYPDCDWTSWKRPLRDPCPNCGNLLYVQNKDWAACETCQERYKLDSFPSHEQPESA